jgi:hypothetical protein
MAKRNTEPAARPTTRRRAAGAAASGVAADDKMNRTPSHDEIAEAAYRRYLSRGGDHGRDFDDWLEAERELRERSG